MLSRTSLACSLTIALLSAAGCSSGRPGGDGTGPDAGEVSADAPPFTNGVSTLAGDAEAKYYDGDRAHSRFSDPVNCAWGPDGKLYVADFDNSKLRVVDTEGNTTTLVNQKNFVRPFGLLFLADGTLLAETDNDSTGANNLMSGTLWKVDINAKTATVFANAIGRPRGLALLPNGLVAMSDEFHHVIRTIDPNSGAIADLAGTWDQKGMVDAVGAAARFSTPYGMAVRSDGTLMVADYDNSRIRSIAMDGTVTTMSGTVAGFADGAMDSAQFKHPQAMAADANGNVYVTDLDNFRIRKISTDGVATVAGDGTPGFEDNDDPTAAKIYGLEGMTLTKDGTMLYFADGNRGTTAAYNRIRQVKL